MRQINTERSRPKEGCDLTCQQLITNTQKFLHAKQEAIGKDKMYLTARGAKTGATVDEIVSDQMSIFDLVEQPDLDFCDSGYCMV